MTELATVEPNSKMTAESQNRMSSRQYGNRLFLLLVLVMLAAGWYQREDSYLEAESGLGYALGIIGGSLMLLLLLYPLRKRLRAMARVMSVGFWFRLHMVFGILGPLAILYHSNFSLGSINSTVALVCMLLVASSGLVGKYLYVRIHHGLYGARTRISEYRDRMESRREVLARYLPRGDEIVGELQRLEKLGLSQARGLLHSLRLRRMVKKEIAGTRKRLRRTIREEIKNGRRLDKAATKVIINSVEQYLQLVKQTADLQVNERLFGWWHILHLPLFFMMLVAGIVHVFVVHVY